MRKLLSIAALAAAATSVAISGAVVPAAASTGNGAPSGAHYNLNLIGVADPKTQPMTSSDGHTIFVPLNGGCKINLTEGSFDVLDRNCTDGPAAFQLPNPDPGNTGTTVYSVYARALGKPGGSSTMNTCFTDTTTNETYCSIYQVVQTRTTAKSSFTNVSQELLYVYYCDTTTGKIVRSSLFDSSLYDYYWQYTNSGLRLEQLRFYPGQQTTVATAGAAC
jgi:hypothetical protein